MNRRATAAAMPAESALQVAVRVLAPLTLVLVVVVLLITVANGAGST